MTQLLVLREQLKKFISTYEHIVRPVGKFLLALITFIMINSNVGYTEKLNNAAIVLILSLLCSFLPDNLTVVLAAFLILLHLYTLSLESVVFVGIVMLIMFLLYFRFSPKDTILLLFTPMCFVLKIPYVIPLSAGLVSSPASFVSVGCGTVIYYMLAFIKENAASLAGQDTENFLNTLKVVIDGVIQNKEMMVVVIAFSLTIIVVNLIRRLPVDHSWTIAIVTGTLLDIVVILAGDLKYNTYISVSGLLFGSLVAVLVVIVIKFFIFNVDYTRTERVQFEDDEYYYYVKAVPKNTVTVTNKQVKKIKTQSKSGKKKSSGASKSSNSGPYEDKDSYYLDEEDEVSEYQMHRSATINSENKNISNKMGTKRIILPDEEKYSKDAYARATSSRSATARRTDSQGMTGIERAAAAKARANRQSNNQN